ncbi:MAG: glutamyl-tRNA reductase [Deltaproteobacteria bacterium]|nr:glutamyl-tRNA reductase [Deltaproteobacteria bacterium]MBW2065446.1 glutamyl-tRNA reductase [Deltaproteobacteria bacterium]
MITILDIGMNHQTAPIELRESLAKDPQGPQRAVTFIREIEWVKEGMFLSTCNRVEALCVTEYPLETREAIIRFLSQLSGLPEQNFLPNLYIHQDQDAVRHIFRVTSSLDSMVVGEPQILGQIKDAYSLASKAKVSGTILNKLMHRAFHVAKRVRTETNVADSAVSISYAAVELSKKIFFDLSGKKVLLIGAGEMAELAARHLLNNGVSSILVSNRTFEKAVRLAEVFKGRPLSFDEIGTQLLEADIVITSTASPDYVITAEDVRSSMRKRKNRPLFFIDIAVPRDVEPAAHEISNVYLYDIDDLKGVTELNLAQRKKEAIKAERIVQEEVIKFEKWLKTLSVVPTIISLREKAEAIRLKELKKSLSLLKELSPSQRDGIERLTMSIAEKIINDPIVVLKGKADRATRDAYLDMTRKLFKLDNDENEV